MANTVVQPPIADVTQVTDPVYSYASDNGFFTASFAQTIGTDDAVKFTTNGYSFAWKPENVIYVDDQGNMDVVFGVNAQATAQVYKNRVSYVGTTQITTDVFECQENQLKHTIQMVAPPRIPAGFVGTPVKMASGGVITYDSSLQVFADGQVQTADFEVTGDIGFKDVDGTLIYKLPMITVEDADGNSTTGTYKVTFNADGTISFYGMVPWDFLQTAAYPVIIDPTVVVSSAYDTSGNGGRKIVRLSNGWIITGAVNGTTLNLFVSKDNGQTWSSLTTCSNTLTAGSWAMASTGTTVYVITCLSTAGNNSFYVFDATTVSTSVASRSQPDTGQSSFGSGVSLAIDGTGALHATWCSKNSTYPNSFNIRYSKSTDGGNTWSTPTQVTSQNTSGNNLTNPCIVIRSNNYPVIIYQGVISTTSYFIATVHWNGSSFVGGSDVYDAGSYTQCNPCAAVDSNDVIHVVWHGTDATNTSTYEIKYSKSTDGGSTWSAMVNITSTTSANHNYYPSITIDPSNNLYVFYQYDAVGGTNNIYKVSTTGGSWGSPVQVTTNTTNQANNPQTLWSKFNMNSSDAVRYMWQDNQVASVKYDSITLNSPPNAPTLTAHANFDATTAQTFNWTFSDPDSGNTQSAYELQIVDTSNNSVVVDTGKVGSTSSSYTLPANTLSNGKNYQWRVQTWDQSGAQGPYSGYSTFSTAAAPIVAITSPANGGTINQASVTAQWTYSDPAGNIQQSYQAQLLDGNDSVVLEDTGTVTSTNTARTFTTTLANNTYYHIKVWATNSKGVKSAASDIYFQTSFTPPATPTATATNNDADSSVSVTFSNPTPSGGQPTVSSNNVYRRKTGTTNWTLIKQGATSPHVDYTCPLGEHDYSVTGVSSSGVESAYGTATVTNTFTGEWLIDESNPANNVVFLYNQRESDATVNQSYTPVQTFAKYPRIRKGQARYRTGNLTALKLSQDGDVISQVDAIDNMCNSDNTYLLKSVNGRIYRVSLSQFKYTGKYGNSIADCSVVWTEVGDV